MLLERSSHGPGWSFKSSIGPECPVRTKPLVREPSRLTEDQRPSRYPFKVAFSKGKSMWIVGLTGGIAAGKSFVSKAWKQKHGFAVVDADAIAHSITARGTLGHRLVAWKFGTGVLDEEGGVDRQKLGELVFRDSSMRRKLNSILHPLVLLHILGQLAWHWLMCRPYVLLDAPLLFETGLHKITHWTVTVWCSEETQLQRLQERDGLSDQHARDRMAAQMSQGEKRRKADYAIDNSGSREQTCQQLDHVARKIVQPGRTLISWMVSPVGLLALGSAAYCAATSWMDG
eukprot:scaffold467_cov366-Pavlova_lutheri.AAC.28